jgi:hypothetical protein
MHGHMNVKYVGYSEINVLWAVKKTRKKEKYFIIYKR